MTYYDEEMIDETLFLIFAMLIAGGFGFCLGFLLGVLF